MSRGRSRPSSSSNKGWWQRRIPWIGSENSEESADTEQQVSEISEIQLLLNAKLGEECAEKLVVETQGVIQHIDEDIIQVKKDLHQQQPQCKYSFAYCIYLVYVNKLFVLPFLPYNLFN